MSTTTTTTTLDSLALLADALEQVEAERAQRLQQRAELTRLARAEGAPWSEVTTALRVSREMGRRIAVRATVTDEVEQTDAAAPDACGVPWRVCPDHGNTLSATDGSTWCTAPRCDRGWPTSHVSGPCPEPVTHHLIDQAGTGLDMCAGHAIAARHQMPTGTVTARAWNTE